MCSGVIVNNRVHKKYYLMPVPVVLDKPVITIIHTDLPSHCLQCWLSGWGFFHLSRTGKWLTVCFLLRPQFDFLQKRTRGEREGISNSTESAHYGKGPQRNLSQSCFLLMFAVSALRNVCVCVWSVLCWLCVCVVCMYVHYMYVLCYVCLLQVCCAYVHGVSTYVLCICVWHVVCFCMRIVLCVCVHVCASFVCVYMRARAWSVVFLCQDRHSKQTLRLYCFNNSSFIWLFSSITLVIFKWLLALFRILFPYYFFPSPLRFWQALSDRGAHIGNKTVIL